MDCPVCGTPAATDITPNTYDGKAVRCPACGEFDVVGSVYEPGALKALELNKRKDALDRARLQAILGYRPRITRYDLRGDSVDGHGHQS
jgi:hypothetical protein